MNGNSFLYEPFWFFDHLCVVVVEVIKNVIGSGAGTWLARLARLADLAWLSRQTWPLGAARRLVELEEAMMRASGG